MPSASLPAFSVPGLSPAVSSFLSSFFFSCEPEDLDEPELDDEEEDDDPFPFFAFLFFFLVSLVILALSDEEDSSAASSALFLRGF